MSNQGGLKHAATEPSHLENKRERRRGAAGRAAVLRRAPSDSDCSGETASLSADSGDRVVRPQPPPVRSGKSRSRRRGSEWEVLEGLKDGQRFDRRPEVFNGYLHKKRKWPLKGWHKRFFVVDGGILVYARSPTDVARGRLHGSVDVGLSVISAKARRRRIDIDADEFIYHLRAKTPDVFRTWLNVLKVHRLYRQHLLTFGARESIPKIHPPLEDLPPPDSTPRMSHSSQESFSSSTSEGTIPKDLDSVLSQKLSQKLTYNSSIYKKKSKNSINNWFSESFDKNKLLPLKFEPLDKLCNEKTDTAYQNHGSLCSMNCVVRRLDSIPYEDLESQSPKWSPGLTDNENHMQSKQLDSNSLKSADLQIQSSLMYKCSFNTAVNKTSKSSDRSFQSKEVMSKRKRSIFVDKSIDPTTAFFFFSRKRIQSKSLSMKESGMKRSKKCTNLVKYKNMSEEPPLPKPLSKSMLLATKFREKVSRGVGSGGYAVPKTVISYAVQVNTATEHKSLQDTMTSSEYDGITEKIMLSMFECYSNKYKTNYDTVQVKYYLDQIVRELYSLKWSQTDEHPVKILFRCLLEYWLKNTSLENFKETMTQVKSVNRQSNKHFAQYENLSSLFSNKFDKDSKVRICNVKHKTKENKKEDIFKGPSETTASYEKEKRIQELEKLLKSTVYICETARARRSKEKDIETTRKIMDNFENFTRKSDVNHFNDDDIKDNSDSSTELPRLQETINDLISSTAIPPGIAKEFFGAYLDVLLNESSKSINSYSSPSAGDSNNNNPKCDVQTETVRINVSTNISTLKENPELSNKTLEGDKEEALLENQQPVEPGQFYLKSILEKLTTIFSKVDPTKPNSWSKNVKKKVSKPDVAITEGKMKNKLGRPMHKNSGHNLITENKNDNTVVVNLSKFDLEKISLFSDPGMKGTMLITLKVKERPDAFSEFRHTTLNLNFFNRNSSPLNLEGNKNTWTSCNSTTTNNAILRSFDTCTSFKNPFLDLDFNRERIDLKPYLSSSDATSKRYCHITHGSENSLDLTFFKSNSFVKGLSDPKISFEGKHDPQCYIMSSLKKKSTSIIQSKKKVKIKTSDGISLNRSESSSRSETGRPPELLFGKATPRIIDENFIILLLENLSLLSQSTPELHKDINSLYVKLKKKQEKLVKNSSNTQGLGLLGKIYNEVDMIQVKDDSTQFDMNICPMTRMKTVESGINTGIYSNCAGPSSTPVQFIDKSLSAFVVCIKHNQCGVQTDNIGCCSEDTQIASTSKRNITDYSLIETKTCNAQTYVTSKHDDVRQETTICDSKRRKESSSRKLSLSAAIKCIVNNNDSCNNFRCVSCKDEEIKNAKKNTYQTTTKSRMHSNKVREDLVHELSPVSPLKNCMRSQSDGKTAEIVNNLSENDFKLYRLFVSSKYNPNKSNSVTDSKIIIKERSDDLKTIYRCANNRSFCSGLISPTSPPLRGPQAGFVSGTPGGRLAGWIIESGGPLENVSRELGQAQLSLQQLQRLLDALELQHQVHHDTDVSLEGASPSVKKDRRKFGLRKKKSNSKCASVELTLPQHIDPSSSYMALSTLTAPPSPGGGSSSMPNSAASLPIAFLSTFLASTLVPCAAARPQSLPGAESLGPMAGPASLTSLTPDQQLREDFTVLAKDLLTTLKGLMSTLVCERGRLRAAMDATDTTSPTGGAVVAALRTNLTSALQQNSELRSRLSRIHDASDLTEITAVNTEVLTRQFHQSLSYSSSCVSASEFFDAEEHDDDLKPTEILDADETGVIELDGDSTSEAGSMSSEDGSASSDNSDGAMLSAEQVALRLNQNGIEPLTSRSWTRRTCLPCPRPTPGGPSLWNLLYKNIGKDLSQISMPVTINEPLNMLQRLCEELEYSELLDAACECKSAVERMALIAAFAVSAYAASAHRAASKPFNPLLAETYECVRDDRGFRFLAEQVSHHPPISACHAESPRWCFWQEARIKTKFWGKSMEFQPTGRVHVRLFSTGDHYSWNKVTTCVHNLFGGQRWVDQYGDMHIVCHGTDISCKLNFIKASSWSSSRHEVRGAVAEGGSGTRLRLQGRWSEALYAGEPPAARCLWRPGAMPPEHEVYYGFTRFAMELNELEPGMRDVLPHTDTRLRPDQRALEEGDVEAAERYKRDLEQSQRERRRDIPDHTPRWFRKTSEGGEETWLFTGEYWKAREAGFSEHGPRIW